MDPSTRAQDQDLILHPNKYALILDRTSGAIHTYRGPSNIPLSQQQTAVKFEAVNDRFIEVSKEQAPQNNINVPKGHYAVLSNPEENGKHPTDFGKNTNATLLVGQKRTIPGPTTFSLWPGQFVKVYKAPILRTNEYLLCRVFDEDAARESWDQATVKTQTDKLDNVDNTGESTGDEKEVPNVLSDDDSIMKVLSGVFNLTAGELFIIPGTAISMYVPPSGIGILREEGTKQHIRKAVTLERLEQCILLDENGDKRYINGPAVVFPRPTERFVTTDLSNGKKTRKFRAKDLNKISGIYIKVTAPYTEVSFDNEGNEVVKEYKAGDELFITGEDTMIYFPRKEHSIIKYAGKEEVHFAVAIPKGDARYVLDRLTGDIRLVRGPDMFLPNPIKEVIVRRILDDRTTLLWFPGNTEALSYNRTLADLLAAGGEDYLEESQLVGQSVANTVLRGNSNRSLSPHGAMQYKLSVSEDEDYETSVDEMMMDTFERKSQYTPPRTIVIDDKFGAIKIQPWTGYAVLVVNGFGERKVIVGPSVHLLEYDEELEAFSLSTGKPKSTERIKRDVYLRVLNNSITDIITAETKDMVNVDVKVVLKVDFTGDPDKWFNVENYVKYLCDSIRSMIRNVVKRMNIQDFHANYIDVIRDTILGKSEKGKGRQGRLFEENGMLVKDVEILGKTIRDAAINEMLTNAQRKISQRAIDTELQQSEVELIKLQEEARVRMAEIKSTAAKAQALCEIEVIKAKSDAASAEHDASLKATLNEAKLELEKSLSSERIESEVCRLEDLREDAKIAAQIGRVDALDLIAGAELTRKRNIEEWDIQRNLEYVKTEIQDLESKAKAGVDIMKAIQPELVAALESLAAAGVLEKALPAMAPPAILKQMSIGGVLLELLEGTKAGEAVKKLMKSNNITA